MVERNHRPAHCVYERTLYSGFRFALADAFGNCVFKLAEREGFEPSVALEGYTHLAGGRFRPLSHLSKCQWEDDGNMVENSTLKGGMGHYSSLP